MTTPTNDGVQEVVRAKRFELVDDDGQVRGRMEISEGRPILSLLNANGVEQWRASVADDGTAGLSFSDREGNLHLFIGYESEHDTSCLDLLDAERNVRLSAWANNSGITRLAMSDQNGVKRLSVSVETNGTPNVDFWDDAGHTRRL